jgi:hypothetical protein
MAFRRAEIVASPTQNGQRRLWLPLFDGVARLGGVEVLGLEDTVELEDVAPAFASLLAELIVVNDAYSDVFARFRRRRPLTWPRRSNGTCCRR